jgi:hypothetical protein
LEEKIMINIPKNKNVGEKLWKEKIAEQNLYIELNRKEKEKKRVVAWWYCESGEEKHQAPPPLLPRAMLPALAAAPITACARCSDCCSCRSPKPASALESDLGREKERSRRKMERERN